MCVNAGSNGTLIATRPEALNLDHSNLYLFLIHGNPDDYVQHVQRGLKDYITNTTTYHVATDGGLGVFDYRASQLCVYDKRNQCIQTYKSPFPRFFSMSCSTKVTLSAQVKILYFNKPIRTVVVLSSVKSAND